MFIFRLNNFSLKISSEFHERKKKFKRIIVFTGLHDKKMFIKIKLDYVSRDPWKIMSLKTCKSVNWKNILTSPSIMKD